MISDIEPNTTAKDKENDIFWGTALWIFLHVLANKIKSDSFHIIRNELLQNIHTICNNISCNICKTHATEYLEKHNFMHIKTVNEFKIFLFIFHNSVNLKKNRELFLFENLTKYDEFKLSVVLQSILKYNYIFDTNNENEIINTLKTWFSTNITYFNE